MIPRARPSRGRRAPVPSVRWRVCVVTERRNAFTRTLTHRLAHVRSGSDRSAAASQLQNYLQRHRGPCLVMTGTRKRRSNRFRTTPRPSTWRNRGTFTDTVASISKNVTEIHTGTLNRINQIRDEKRSFSYTRDGSITLRLLSLARPRRRQHGVQHDAGRDGHVERVHRVVSTHYATLQGLRSIPAACSLTTRRMTDRPALDAHHAVARASHVRPETGTLCELKKKVVPSVQLPIRKGLKETHRYPRPPRWA